MTIKIGKIIKLKQNDETLKNVKWGVVINSDELILDLNKRLFKNSIKTVIPIKNRAGFKYYKK